MNPYCQQQQRMYFTEEIEKIVSHIPHKNQRNQRFVDDANVRHRGTEIYSHLGVVSEIFDFNFDIEEMMTRYAPEISPDVVFRWTLRRIINHLLTVSYGTLTTEQQLFRIFFDRFPESEYTTLTITRHDLTINKMYDKLDKHLQSNDQIATEGVWSGYMVVSRLVVDRRRRRVRNWRDDVPFENTAVGDDAILQGCGKIENCRDKLGLFQVNVENHCLGRSILLGMSLNDKSELYRAFMAGFDRYLKVVVQDQLMEIENSCEILSQIEEVKKYSMKRLYNNYLKEKIWVLWFTHKKRELKGFISRQRKATLCCFIMTIILTWFVMSVCSCLVEKRFFVPDVLKKLEMPIIMCVMIASIVLSANKHIW